MTSLLCDALGYHARGLCIIPIRHKSAGGKEPACRRWKPYQSRRPSETTLRRWFASDDLDGLAVVLGDVSGGVVCRDFDVLPRYERWAEEQPDLARKLPTVETARGRHIYFRHDIRRIEKLGDGELRGAGYCLLPHSRHPTGKVYEWVNSLPDGPIPALDPFAVGLAQRDTERTERLREQSNRETEAIRSGGNEREIEKAIASTLPTRFAQRNRLVFELARTLKAIPALGDANARAVRCYVEQWHALALPFIRTKPFDDTWADFLYAWPRVKYPKGTEPMAQILERADTAEPPAAAMKYDSPETRRLVALCRELQRAAGDSPFFLSCRMAGELLGIDHMMAWRRLFLLEADGLIQTVKPGTKTKATRYRYVASDSPSRSNT